MKRKFWKILALAVAIALLIGVCGFANALTGNPLSKLLAERAAEKYLAQTYPGTDYTITDVGYNFKFGNYYAKVVSESSMDTYFTIYANMLGKVEWDTFDSVTSGYNTQSRLWAEYRALTDQILDNPGFPYYPLDIGFGELVIYEKELIDSGAHRDIPSWSIELESLVLDQEYDIRELGRQAGHLNLYVYSDELTYEKAAQVLLTVRAEFDQEGIPFRSIDLTLRHPKTEDGPWDEEYIGVEFFLYEDIYEDGLTDRVAQADAELKAYRAILDAETAALAATAPEK